MSLAYDHLHGIIVCVRSGSGEDNWQALADYIVTKSAHCKGVLFITEGKTATVQGRTTMHVALDVAKHLRVAFITNNEMTRVLLQRVIREYLGDRVLDAGTLEKALAHLGAARSLETDFANEIARLKVQAGPSQPVPLAG